MQGLLMGVEINKTTKQQSHMQQIKQQSHMHNKKIDYS